MRNVNAVTIARFELCGWPPQRPFLGGVHASCASSENQTVISPRLLRPRSYSCQLVTRYFVLYLRFTLLDLRAAIGSSPRSSMYREAESKRLPESRAIRAPKPLRFGKSLSMLNLEFLKCGDTTTAIFESASFRGQATLARTGASRFHFLPHACSPSSLTKVVPRLVPSLCDRSEIGSKALGRPSRGLSSSGCGRQAAGIVKLRAPRRIRPQDVVDGVRSSSIILGPDPPT